MILSPLSGCATRHAESDQAALATKIVDGATAMLGQPYRYGGAAPGGFDCSGLVVYAAAGAGLRLPRTAKQQLHAGFVVSKRNVRAGDLVFLHLAGKELHVGIAIDAKHFIHAPSTGGRVRIDSLDAAPYADAYAEARRITPGALTPGALTPGALTPRAFTPRASAQTMARSGSTASLLTSANCNDANRA